MRSMLKNRQKSWQSGSDAPPCVAMNETRRVSPSGDQAVGCQTETILVIVIIHAVVHH